MTLAGLMPPAPVRRLLCRAAACLAAMVAALGLARLVADEYKSGIPWSEPKVVDPGPPGSVPADAIVLFGGKDMDQWHGGDRWIIANGVATAAGGGVTTKKNFGDVQLHIEWATPEKVESEGQGRGNSGVYFMGAYEVQILDSYRNATYFDGQAASIYKQRPPLVNASRKPGEWQSYDIFFKAPKFDKNDKLVRPAYLTVIHNGLCVQNNVELAGATSWDMAPKYTAHADRLPIHLQFHGNPVKFRNIWARDLTTEEPRQPGR
jgi:hypothetical protein